ncbi:MAG: DUF992 domain-containing protein [Alphaproteobacteria bacterium]|nr:DUF992 domain-containing protein [Alphaproteobacteria bacterium]
MKLTPLHRALIASFLASASAAPGLAGEPIANAGTLTCTLSPSTEQGNTAQTKAEASCHFDAISGADGNYEGVIKRKAVTAERGAKIVIVWSVLARTADVPLEDLEGSYRGRLKVRGDDAAADGLVGGRNGSIALRPLNPKPATAPPAGLTELTLKISKLRT